MTGHYGSLTMTLALAALGLMLCFFTASSEVLPQADLNIQGMSGKWYLIGFATNAQWFVSRKGNMKMGTAILTPSDGDLNMAYASLNSDGSCWRMNNLAKKTGVSGRFTYTSYNSVNDMRIVDVKYDEYALIYTQKSNGDGPTVVTKLYGRAADLSPGLLEKFRQFSLENGVHPQNVAFLPKTGEC